MELDAFLADSVVAAEGKVYVQGGGWNSIFALTFPFRQPRLGICVLVRVPYTETNRMHTFTIKMLDDDGNTIPIADAPPGSDNPEAKVRELTGQFNIGRPPTIAPGDEQIVPLAVNIDGLLVSHPGTISVVIEVNGEEKRRLPMRIQQVLQMPQAGPPRLAAS